jgi:hypothetical protein
VTFEDGSTVLGAEMLSGGTATFTTSALAVPSHSITASYGGDGNFTTSTSAALMQTINQDGTTTTVVSSVNPSVVGQSVTVTATVSASTPGSGSPTGTVTFKDGTTTLGTGALSGGTATFSTSVLAAGTHSVTVSYAGSASYAASTSSVLAQAVQIGTATTLASSVNPSVFGQSVTFTATVKASSGTPTGTVAFKDGSTVLGTGTLGSKGTATFSISALAVGGDSITTVYAGAGNFGGDTSTALMQTVNKANSAVTVASSANPSVVGQLVTFTATVTASSPGSGTSTGTVIFKDGGTTIDTGTLTAGKATFTTSALAFGSHSITASYGGDGNYNTGTSGTLTQKVNQASTSTGLTSSLNPSAVGQSVAFTATVTASSPGGGMPTGTVTFKDGTKTLGTGRLNASGVATFTTSTFAKGNHSVTAVYAGSTSYKTSTSVVVTQVVNATGAAVVTNGSTAPLLTEAPNSLTISVIQDGVSTSPTSTVSTSVVSVGIPAVTGAAASAPVVGGTTPASTEGATGEEPAPNTGTDSHPSPTANLDRIFAAFGRDWLDGEDNGHL